MTFAQEMAGIFERTANEAMCYRTPALSSKLVRQSCEKKENGLAETGQPV
jgi:hypothetical protein